MAGKNKGGREIRKPKQTAKTPAKADEPMPLLDKRRNDKPRQK